MSSHVLCCGWLLLAVALPGHGATSPGQAKSDKPAAPAPANKPPPGYHDMTIDQAGHKMVVRVKDQAKPMSNTGPAPSDGHYDPERMDFNKASVYANKSFLAENSPLSKGKARDVDKPYATGGYATSAYKQSGRTFQTAAYKTSSKTDDDFSKSYPLPTGATTGANKTFAVKNSDYQGKQALIAQTPAKVSPFSAPGELTEKKFYDPVTTHLKHDHLNLDVSRMTDLPNRALSVDEVKNLINHEQVPDLDSKPDAPSKALNDPDWAPPDKLPMLDDRAAPATPPPDETKADELPSPGMMALPPPGKDQSQQPK